MTRLLLDSHALFWFIDGHPVSISGTHGKPFRIPPTPSASAPQPPGRSPTNSVWANGQERQAWANDLARIMFALGFEPLPLSLEHARHAGALRNPHRDPFDQMLAAQAEIEDIPLVTADPAFRHFNVRILW